MEVINPVIAIVTSKNVDTATMNNCSVAITRARRLRTAVLVEFAPGVGREVEAEEIVASVGAVIATKDVKIIVDGD